MKRFLLVNVLLLAAGLTAFAQQTPDQVKDTATRFLDQTKANASQLESTQAELNSRSAGSNDMAAFNQLKADIERLERSISAEQNRIRASLDTGVRVNPEMLQRTQRMLNQHKQKTAQLEAFTRAK
jgi:uncharacterized protein HemX